MTTIEENSALRFAACGNPDKVLSITRTPVQELDDGEVLLRMVAAPINPADINFIQGVYGRRPNLGDSQNGLGSPSGMEGFGIVEDSRASDLVPGDRVMVLDGLGTWGHYLRVPSARVLRIDAAIPAEQAAMLKINPMTALRLLTDFAHLQPGDWIVQNASNSGVGRCVIQISRLMGCRTINFVRRQEERVEELTGLGADLVLEDGDPGALKAVLVATQGTRPVLAINGVGGESAGNLLALIDREGCMVTYGGMSRRGVKVSTTQLIFQGLQLRGFWLRDWMQRASDNQIRTDYKQLNSWVSENSLLQAVDGLYPLEKYQEALHRAREEFRQGRVLFDLR